MILIGIGANLPHANHGSPIETCEAALAALGKRGVRVVRRSRWYESAPVPPGPQPWFVNGVAAVETALEPGPLLDLLHAVEASFGRVRDEPGGPRVLDLDLLDYRGRRVADPAGGPTVPHPRLAERAFVLLPLAEIAPAWRHPVSRRPVDRLIADLPPGQVARPVEQTGC